MLLIPNLPARTAASRSEYRGRKQRKGKKLMLSAAIILIISIAGVLALFRSENTYWAY